MRKIYSFMLVMIWMIGILVGCSDASQGGTGESQSTKQAVNQGFPLSLQDAVGNKVTIEQKPEKIVSLIPSNTEVVFALGSGEKVIGVSENDNYPEETKDIQKISGMEIAKEMILALQPDIVLAHESVHNSEEGIQQLRDAGIPVLIVNDAKSFKEVYTSIEMIGTAIGKVDQAKEIVKTMQNKLEKIKEKAKTIKGEDRKSVFVEVSPSPEIYTAGKNTFMDEMLDIISADNVAGELDGWVKLDEESMIAANPDVIITTYGYYTGDPVKEVTGRSGWADIQAVKNRDVYDVHSDIVTRSGPRLIEGVEELAKSVYPNVFKN